MFEFCMVNCVLCGFELWRTPSNLVASLCYTLCTSIAKKKNEWLHIMNDTYIHGKLAWYNIMIILMLNKKERTHGNPHFSRVWKV
jgi:hypothetical protein